MLNIKGNKWNSIPIDTQSCQLNYDTISDSVYDANNKIIHVFTSKSQGWDTKPIRKSYTIDLNNNAYSAKESPIVSPERGTFFDHNNNIHSFGQFGDKEPCKHLILNHEKNEFETFASISDYYGDNSLCYPCILGFHNKNSILIIGGEKGSDSGHSGFNPCFNTIYEIDLSNKEKKYKKWNLKLPGCIRRFCGIITNDDKYIILFAGLRRGYYQYYYDEADEVYIHRIGIDDEFISHPSIQSPFGGICDVFVNVNQREANLLSYGYIRNYYNGRDVFPMELINQLSDWIKIEEIILSNKGHRWKYPNLWKIDLCEILNGIN